MINSIWRNRRVLQTLHLGQRLRVGLWRNDGRNVASRRIRSEFYEAIWRRAANRFGADVRVLDDDVIEIRRADFRTRMVQNNTPLDDGVTLMVAGNKPLTYRLLRQSGIATAEYSVFRLDEIDEAISFLRQLDKDCVVKPATGWAGVGVTTGIRTPAQLAIAAVGARVFDSKLLIQEQILGDNYRLAYLDGKLMDAVVRHCPSVRADGKSTVAALLKAENQRRLDRGAQQSQALLAVDRDMKNTLAHQRLTLSSVPPAGTNLQLKTVINQNSATENAVATHLLCNSVVQTGAAAAEVLGVRLAGVDVITPDPTVPLDEAGGVVIEVNTTPGQHWHYHRQGGEFPLADHILATLLCEHPECGLTPSDVNSLLQRAHTHDCAAHPTGSTT